ncbi:MAG: CotH kinase family protein [Vicinamibacterales bacterium]
MVLLLAPAQPSAQDGKRDGRAWQLARPQVTTAGSHPQEGEAPPSPADALFDGQVLQRVDLLVHSADWAKLKENFRENDYYPADLTWNGQTIRNAGIRSRGTGSRSGSKPGLRVDFNRYADQEFLGLKSLVLDNLTQDASGIHESVAMALYQRLGIPAPREAHARLYVNNEYAGLYVIVESVDKDLLARVFGEIDGNVQNDGYLYEFNWEDEWHFEHLGEDLRPYKDRFDPKTHESESDEQLYRPIEELIRLVDETRQDRLPEAIGDRFDLPGFIRYVAAQNFVGETDGFLGAWGVNNFYLYRLEDQARHVLIAWDADSTFWGPTFPTNDGHDANILMAKLMRVPEYAAMYRAELQRVVDLAAEPAGDTTWLDAEIRRQLDLIDQAMREDSARPYGDNQYDGAAGEMRAFTSARLAYVRCELERGPRSGCESVLETAAGGVRSEK